MRRRSLVVSLLTGSADGTGGVGAEAAIRRRAAVERCSPVRVLA